MKASYRTTLKRMTGISLISSVAVLMSCSQDFGMRPSSAVGPTRLKFINDINGSESVNASLFIGNIYLDYQLGPQTVAGKQLQASDVYVNGQNIYVSYSSFDTGGVVSKIGAVELVKPYACDSPTTPSLIDYCLQSAGVLAFPATDIFASYADGTNLYAVGSTSDESQLPYFGRLYKVSLDSGKAPAAVTATQILNSYAGTGVVGNGTNLLVTYGTSSTNSQLTGGVGAFSLSTLAAGASQSLYDARYVAIDPSSTTSAYVIRGPISGATTGANQSTVFKYATDANSAPPATASGTIPVAGNTIAESKSTVVVGNKLLLASTGDGGFKVICKATGATLASKAAPTITGIPTTKTVTNSLAAIPGYLFVANGEAGVQVYKFKKTSTLQSDYCAAGVTLTSVGRLALDSDNSDATYINAELSANGVKALTILNALNIVTSRLLVVASGNKGLSLLDVSGLTIALDDIDDF